MKTANIRELEENLDIILSVVENGESVQILKQNVPIARLVPCKSDKKKNKTVLGCGQGTVKIRTDLTEPMIPEAEWEMLKK